MDLEDILASEPAGDTSDNYVMPDPYTSSGISADLLTSLKGLLSGKSGTASQLASLGGIGARGVRNDSHFAENVALVGFRDPLVGIGPVVDFDVDAYLALVDEVKRTRLLADAIDFLA